LRDRSFRIVLGGFAGLVAWWALAVPRSPWPSDDSASGPFSAADWPRWLAYGWLLLTSGGQLAEHQGTGHQGTGQQGTGSRGAGSQGAGQGTGHPAEPGGPWAGLRLLVQLTFAVAIGYAVLLASSLIGPFHVKPHAVAANAILVLGLVGVGSLVERCRSRALSLGILVPSVFVFELVLGRAPGALRAAFGLSCLTLGVVALSRGWRTGRARCASQS